MQFFVFWYPFGWLEFYCLFIYSFSKILLFFFCGKIFLYHLTSKEENVSHWHCFFFLTFRPLLNKPRRLWKIQSILLVYFTFKRLEILLFFFFYEPVYLWLFSLKIIKELRKVFKFHVCAKFFPINLHNSWHLFKMLLVFSVRFFVYLFFFIVLS